MNDTLPLKNFFSNLRYRLDIFRINKRQTDLYLSSDFNVFDYIRPDENTISDIISDLLNPIGTHGQKDTFFKNFLSDMNIDIDTDLNTRAVVRREDPARYTQNLLRRIDITIDINGKRAIGIENKPWVGEGKDQVKDYIDHLNKRYKGNFVLIYLSGYGKEPESIVPEVREKLKAQGKLKIVAYKPELTFWLEKCAKSCESEKMRWFLRDFIKYLDGRFNLILQNEDSI